MYFTILSLDLITVSVIVTVGTFIADVIRRAIPIRQ